MKKILLALIFIGIEAKSQTLVLTQASNMPVVGDSIKNYILDTSYYAGGLNVALTGSNTLWTYANLVTTTALATSAIVHPTAVPASTAYAGCSYVQVSGALSNFYKAVNSPSVQTEFMGVNSTSLSMNLTNTAINMRYPFGFGNTIADSYSGAFTFSLSGTATGNANVSADGTGTLQLPGGLTYTNVLRIKSTQTTNFNALIINGSIKQTVYSWYIPTQKYPVLSISYQSTYITGSPSPTVSAQVSGNKNVFIIGLNEKKMEEKNISIYPNPVTEYLSIDCYQSACSLLTRIFSIDGKEVMSSHENKMNLSALPAGIYLAEFSNERTVVKKKFIKE